MKVSIDRDRCVGHGMCYMTALSVFVSDDDGYGQVAGDGDVPDHLVSVARDAVENCPENAVQISD